MNGEANDTEGGWCLIPPCFVIRDFLPVRDAQLLLDHAIATELDYTAATIGRRNRIVPKVRVAGKTKLPDPLCAILREAVIKRLPEVLANLGTPPFDIRRTELELIAHGDGAFYQRHRDTGSDPNAKTLRLLSGVYYLHLEPRRFSGGALRIHSIGTPEQARWTDIEPDHNSFAFFPAWAPHEVRPISCPSGRFEDSRFAINFWAHGPSPGATEHVSGSEIT
jgi:Rps23 Pro-64 3,4-dihydroxylase Tpa1-like proline 4-hydroxylase